MFLPSSKGLFHLEFLACTYVVTLDAIELAQFFHGGVIACGNFREGVTVLDGYGLSLAGAFFLS